MTTACSDAGCAVVRAADAGAHRLLIAGGLSAPVTWVDSCELYDSVADRWSMQEARLPQAMCCRAAPIAGGSAVLVVANDLSPTTRCALLDVRSSSSSWQPMAIVAGARSAHELVAVAEHSVMILGGILRTGGVTEAVQLYDARADRWSDRPEWRLPAPSQDLRAIVIE